MSTNSALRTAAVRWNLGGVPSDLLNAFAIYQRAADLSEATIRNRDSILRHLPVPPLEATINDLREYVGQIGITASSRRTYRNAIVAFYSFLQADGYRDDNPALRLPKVRVPRSTPRPFTVQQIEALLRSGAYRHTRIMICLGYYAGLRVSQIARVQGDDIDGRTIRTIGKGGVEIVIPLHPILARIATVMPSSWWFPARRGQPGHIHSGSVSDLIHKAIRRAGITDPRLSAHSLRHSYGSHMVEAGVDIRVISELMGHASVSTTQIYTQVPDRLRRDGVDRLPRITIPDHAQRAA